MLMETIELPKDMVCAARDYANRIHCSVVELIAGLLADKCGYEYSGFAAAKASALQRDTDKVAPQWLKDITGGVEFRRGKTYGEFLDEITEGGIAPEVKALMGVAKQRSQDAGKSDDDLRWEYFKEKYSL